MNTTTNMTERQKLIAKVKKISARRNIARPDLRSSSTILNQWVEQTNQAAELFKREIKEAKLKIEKVKELRQNIEDKNFQRIIEIASTGYRILKRHAVDVYNAMVANDQKYTVTLNGASFPVNPNNKEFLVGILKNGLSVVDSDIVGSDRMMAVIEEEITSVEVELRTPVEAINRAQDGAFFSRLNSEAELFDLSRYQIYSEAQETENCLIHTLSLCGVADEKINAVKLSLGVGVSIAKKSLKKISEIIKKTIVVNDYDKNKSQTRKVKFGKFEEQIEIALYANHYFIFEQTKYSKYAVRNFKDLYGKKDWFDYFKKNEKSKAKVKINSLNLIVQLDLLDVFYYGDMKAATESQKHVDTRDMVFLDNIQSEQRLIENKKIFKNTKSIYFADCETFVGGDTHGLFLLGIVGDSESEPTVHNFAKLAEYEKQNKIYRIFDTITSFGTRPAIIYFHNLKYDYNVLEQYLNIQNVCKKDNRLYSVHIKFKNTEIELRDSLKIASMPLSSFCENFGLPKELDKLEAINYTYYTNENADDKLVSTELYASGLPVKELEVFWEAVGGRTVEIFDPVEYYIKYLRMDCLVLKYGMEKFDEIITGIDHRLSIHNSLTISSLTDSYMLINGAYSGVFENTGNLRDYLSKAVYGGRVHANQKYIKKVVEEKIADYDGVSLYPSAINRLCREYGFPKGGCVRINKDEIKSVEDFKDSDYAVLTVQIKSVNKIQQMPILAVKGVDSISYTNVCPSKPVIIDIHTLKDYIEFHEVDYEILDGVAWYSENGTNRKMGELINKLFNKRLENKKKNPGLANVLKLMLNSAYGKTITKKSTVQTRIIHREKVLFNPNSQQYFIQSVKDYNKYIYKNFNTIRCIRAISSKIYEVEQTSIDTSYNRGHIGCAILSYSKRIMNEVFDVANTNNLPIYYTDTDSIHMKYNDVGILEKQFGEKYKKELTGKNLEQFHIDFDLKGARGEVWSNKFLALGKKSYIDKLEARDENNNKIEGTHIRLKGITEASVKHHEKEYEGGAFEMFENLAKGESKTMILNPFDIDANYQKPIFEYVSNGVRIRKSGTFIRTIKF